MKQTICARNHIHSFGHGSIAILFAHGFGCSQSTWRLVAPHFSSNYRVILFDYVGAGNSDQKSYSARRYNSLNGYATDILEICEALEVRSCIFVGHSISGMIGALAAMQHPEYIQQLVMIGSSPCYVNSENYFGGFDRKAIEELLDLMERNYGGWASFMAPMAMKNEDRPELAREIEQSFNATSPTIARQFAEVTFLSDNRSNLAKIPCPTLVLQCLDDPIVPVSVGTYLNQHVPNSTLQRIHSIGHFPQLSNPEETAQIISTYLDSQLEVGAYHGRSA